MVKTFLDGERLPVNPLDDLTFTTSANNTTFNVISLGEVSKIGSKNLTKVEIKSLFTGEDYPFVEANSTKSGQYYVDMIYKKIESKKDVRLIVTGDGININMNCSIETFKPSIHFGETKDRYYTLSMREHKEPYARRINLQPNAKKATKTVSKRSEKTAKSTGYTVKKGDSLWAIAQKHFGDGSRWKEIYASNKGTVGGNPNLILPGQNLKLP